MKNALLFALAAALPIGGGFSFGDPGIFAGLLVLLGLAVLVARRETR